MRNIFRPIILILSIFQCTAGLAQPLVSLENEFLFKSAWQESMPDTYVLGDSIVLSAGMNTNMSTLHVNFLIRWMRLDGTVKLEKEIYLFSNPDRQNFGLISFFSGSDIDDEFLYMTGTSGDTCLNGGDMSRIHKLVKIKLSDGSLVNEKTICSNDLRVWRTMDVSTQSDTIYLYGSLGYLNLHPKIVLTTMTKDFNALHDLVLNTSDTDIMPMSKNGNPREVAGTHNKYDFLSSYNLQDIWYGKIKGNKIVETYRMNYFFQHALTKVFILDENEKAFLGQELNFPDETSVQVFRDDTLAWNFYDAFYTGLSDIRKIRDRYSILQDTYRRDDRRQQKIILHEVDHDGFPYSSHEYLIPWFEYTMGSVVVGEFYYVFVSCTDWDEYMEVQGGTIPLEDGRMEYTHVLKFRIND